MPVFDSQHGYLYIRLPSGQGVAYPLVGESMRIGRDPAAEINIDHPSLDINHARLHFQGQFVGLEDLGSEQGTAIDNNRLLANRIYVVTDDARIRLGVVFARWYETRANLPTDAILAGSEAETLIAAASLEPAADAALPENSDDLTLLPDGELTQSGVAGDGVKLLIEPTESEGDFNIIITSLTDVPITLELATGSRFIDLDYNLGATQITLAPSETANVPLTVTCNAEQWQRRPFKLQAQMGSDVIAQTTAVLVTPKVRAELPAWLPWGIGAAVIVLLLSLGAVVLGGSLPDWLLRPTEASTELVIVPQPANTFTPEIPTATVRPSNTPRPTRVGGGAATVQPSETATFTPTPTATLRYPDGVLAYKTGQVGNESLIVLVPGSTPLTVIANQAQIQVLGYTGRYNGVFAVKVTDANGVQTLWLVQPDGTEIRTEINEGWDVLTSVNFAPDASYFLLEAGVGGATRYFVFDTQTGALNSAVSLVAATVTLTPTFTFTPTATLTVTPSRTPTTTLTPTLTATQTVTPSPTPTATRTSTPTRTNTPTPEPIVELPTVTPSSTLPNAPEPTATTTGSP